MGTKIEWTHAPGFQGETWNPVTGCSKVSAGCKNCWAEGQFPRSYKRHGRVFADVQFHPERLSQPLRWRKPRMIAVNLMGDLFHESVTNEQIAAVFGVMAACPQHRFLVLTKRAARLPRWFKWYAAKSYSTPDSAHTAHVAAYVALDDAGFLDGIKEASWPLSNVWIGVSVEDQQTADDRFPLLFKTPAAVHFVSYEPALGVVEIDPRWLPCASGCGRAQSHDSRLPIETTTLDWIIVGGESGHKARDMDTDWARSIRDQCKAAGVPFFFKQMSRKAPIPDDLMIREFPGRGAQ